MSYKRIIMRSSTPGCSIDPNADPMRRLPSLKPPRDLTLGVGPKKFEPNLNVTRNKNSEPSTSGVQAPKKAGGRRKNRKNEKSKNSAPNIIKSYGVFSEGVAIPPPPPPRPVFVREKVSPDLVMPPMKIWDSIKIDRKLQKLKINESGESSQVNVRPYVDDSGIPFSKTAEKDAPVKLPMEHVKEAPQDVKLEQGESEVSSLLNTKEPVFILIQLPDALPGIGGKLEEPKQTKTSDDPSTSSESSCSSDTPVGPCTLSDLQEGRIGTLRTHRSGRVSLLLGESVFEINMGTQAGFQQEVVSVTCDDANETASLVSLGTVQHKLVATPQWETLLKEDDVK